MTNLFESHVISIELSLIPSGRIDRIHLEERGA